MRLQLFLIMPAIAGLAVAETDVHFGVASITSFETARVAAFCSGDASAGRMAEPCLITFLFHPARGGVLKQAIVTLAPGTGDFLDLRGTEAGAGGSPVEIIPCIRVGRGGAFASFQSFDNFTARTRLLALWGGPPDFRPGKGEFAPAGITPFDMARVSAFCSDELTLTGLPAEACDVEFKFHDLSGRLLKQSTITLQPGAAGSLDLRAAEAGITSGRGEIQARMTVGRGAAVGGLRVIDTLSGRTNALANPSSLAQ